MTILKAILRYVHLQSSDAFSDFQKVIFFSFWLLFDTIDVLLRRYFVL